MASFTALRFLRLHRVQPSSAVSAAKKQQKAGVLWRCVLDVAEVVENAVQSIVVAVVLFSRAAAAGARSYEIEKRSSRVREQWMGALTDL